MEPPPQVLAAFGASGRPVPLHGGQGECWRCGDVVLKPAPDEADVIAEVMAGVVEDGFRVARPLRCDSGWVCDGWTAWTFVEGRHRDDRIADEVAACEAFHRAVAHLPRPAFTSSSVYRDADRIAWGEALAPPGPCAALLDQLAALRAPVDLPSQLVHGDLGGNVLFADGLASAVIDLAPYWRPAAYATAVVVADAVTWRGAEAAVLDAAPFPMLVRAVARTVDLLERRS